MADAPVLQVQLDVINQEIEYVGTPKTIPESYWKDTLTPLLYPLWDSDKDKLIIFQWYTNDTYIAKRRKYVKDFKTDTYSWVDYEMEQVGVAEATALKDKLIDGFYLIDSLENDEFSNELARMYSKQKEVSPLSIRLARNFLLDETDWTQLPDAPIDADLKAQYTLYRTKLRDITATTEFSTAVETTKFPISPDFYNKIYKTENVGEDYLATDKQFLPLASHYLKRYRDRMAHYLLTKSWTERSYFDTFILEYNNVKAAAVTVSQDNEDKKAFLDKMLIEAQAEIDRMEGN